MMQHTPICGARVRERMCTYLLYFVCLGQHGATQNGATTRRRDAGRSMFQFVPHLLVSSFQEFLHNFVSKKYAFVCAATANSMRNTIHIRPVAQLLTFRTQTHTFSSHKPSIRLSNFVLKFPFSNF